MHDFYMLNDLIGNKVTLHGKTVGRLEDIIAKENGTLPLVVAFYVSRHFGNPSLLIPWENVRSVTTDEIVINVDDIKNYEHEPSIEQIKLKDHILDKKILDTEDRDIDVVYDIKLVVIDNKLYVSDVDISRTGLLRRIKLGKIADLIENKIGKDRQKLIHWRYIQNLPTPIGRFRGDVKLKILKEKLDEMHPVDLADILEELDYKERASVFEKLDTSHASDTLEEVDPRVQRELIAALKKEKVVHLITHMTSGQAADVLSVLPHNEVRTILKLMDENTVRKIKSILTKQEEDIVNYSTSKFLRFSPDMTVSEARQLFLETAKKMKVVMYIYVVDEKDKLLGVIDIKQLLEEKDEVKLKSIMEKNYISLKPRSTLKQALDTFDRYDFRALPIIDKGHKIIGVVPYRDMKRLKHHFLE